LAEIPQNELAPTTTVGLFDDSIAVSEIDNLFPDSNRRAFACHWSMILPETASTLAVQRQRLWQKGERSVK